jgi:hypothetical protein
MGVKQESLWVCCFGFRLWCWESNWWCVGVHFVVRDGFISEIMILSANEGFQELAPSRNGCLSPPRNWSRNPFKGDILILTAIF